MACIHRLGERCECGHLTVPVRFYWKEQKEVTHEKAEAAYLEHLREHMPKLYEKLVESSRPITRKHKNLGEVEEALQERERPHMANKKPHTTIPGRLRRK